MHVLDMHVLLMHILNAMTLAEYMTLRGLRDHEMANVLGLSREQISRIRRGVSKPSLDVALRIEEITRGAVRPVSFAPPRLSSRLTSPTP